MIHRTSPSNERTKVSATRDFPYGCGAHTTKNQRSENGGELVAVTGETTREKSFDSAINRVGVADQDHHRKPSADRFKEDESFGLILKKAGFNLAANANVGSARFASAKRKFPPSCESKVKPLSSEETMRLMASQGRRGQLSYSSSHIRKKPLLAKGVLNPRNSPVKRKLSNAATLRAKTHKPTQSRDERRSNHRAPISVALRNRISKALSPRGRVLRTLHRFSVVFKELDRDKAARRGKTVTSRIYYETRNILLSEGMQVNGAKMIGAVPGIEVGDVFQFKSQLNLIGLHFDMRGGIDYINKGGMKLATSIISSEGNDYGDIFDFDVMIYTGQGGNVTSKDRKAIEDQKLVNGNMALVNSMKAKTQVRVIHGKKRVDKRGKHYVYVGLYLVEDYWQEKGTEGNRLFKFRLCRVSGQPSIA